MEAAVILFIVLSSSWCRSSAILVPVDYLALQSIRKSLSDLPGSSFFARWDFTSDPCAFPGVFCSGNCIVALALGDPAPRASPAASPPPSAASPPPSTASPPSPSFPSSLAASSGPSSPTSPSAAPFASSPSAATSSLAPSPPPSTPSAASAPSISASTSCPAQSLQRSLESLPSPTSSFATPFYLRVYKLHQPS